MWVVSNVLPVTAPPYFGNQGEQHVKSNKRFPVSAWQTNRNRH
jgi:hypothetical protein